MGIEGKTKVANEKKKKKRRFTGISLRKRNWSKIQVKTKEVPTHVRKMRQITERLESEGTSGGHLCWPLIVQSSS